MLLVASMTALAVPSQAGSPQVHLRMKGGDATYFSPNGDGRLLRDGRYPLRIVARTASGQVFKSDWAPGVILDTTMGADEIRLDWPAVYPLSTAVSDRVEIAYYSRKLNELWGWVRGRVVGASGEVVDRLRWDDAGYLCALAPGGFGLQPPKRCGYGWSWTGRSGDQPLTPGRYRVTVVAQDKAGNRRQEGTWIRVSGAQLEPVHKSFTVPADSGHWCNDNCGEFQNCGEVVVPGRFGTGSVSLRSATDCGTPYHFAASTYQVPFDPLAAPGEFRVTLYGGPTQPGDSDTAELTVQDAGDLIKTSTGPDSSDHETTSPWVPLEPEPARSHSMWWHVTTRDTDSYDVAWFRIDYTVYEPAS